MEMPYKTVINESKTYSTTMKIYYGIITAIVGALLLILSYLVGWVDYNFVQGLGILLIIVGIGLHIYFNYKKPKYDE